METRNPVLDSLVIELLKEIRDILEQQQTLTSEVRVIKSNYLTKDDLLSIKDDIQQINLDFQRSISANIVSVDDNSKKYDVALIEYKKTIDNKLNKFENLLTIYNNSVDEYNSKLKTIETNYLSFENNSKNYFKLITGVVLGAITIIELFQLYLLPLLVKLL